MVDFGSQKVKVLVVPADRTVPIRVKELAPDRFETELGGRPEVLMPVVLSAPPVDWMMFVSATARGGAPLNLRAQQLCAHLGASPGQSLPGTVLVVGRAPGQRIRGVPGIFAQLAALMGMQVRTVE